MKILQSGDMKNLPALSVSGLAGLGLLRSLNKSFGRPSNSSGSKIFLRFIFQNTLLALFLKLFFPLLS